METRFRALKSASQSLLIGAFVLAGISHAISPQDHGHGDHGHGDQATAEKSEFSGDPYLLEIDIVSGKPLGALKEQVIIQHEDRELRFSGAKTAAAFRADPAKFLTAIDQKMIEQQRPYYPLETCVISGEKLGGEMGDPIDVIYKNRLVRLCCKGCKKGLAKDPAAQIAKIDKAVVAEQQKDYPLSTCPVSGEALGSMGDTIDYVIGNRMIRLCCKGCVKKVTKDPLTYLAKLDSKSASGQAHKPHGDGHGDHDHGGLR